MIEALLDTIKEFFGMTKRNTLHDNLKFTFRSLEDQVIPVLNSVASEENKDLKAINKSTLLTNFLRSCNIKSRDNLHGISILANFFQVVVSQEKAIAKLIDKAFDENIADKTITAKQAAIIKLINDINGMQSFILDFIYYAISDKNNLPKIKVKSIQEHIPTFANMYKIYSKNFEQYVKDLDKISNETIGDQMDGNNFAMLDKRLVQTGGLVELPISNFVGNPIYHFRMWLVDRDVKKLESLKTKRQIIELRLVELKNEAAKDTDPRVAKQIEYYEDKLADIEYQINKIES